MKTKVSIIIPCYNSEKWVSDCVLSALRQEYENIEVIAVDNESTDKTQQILEDIKKEYPNLVLSSAKNIYPNCWDEARAEGFRLMTGEYVTVIGSDDIIDPKYISNCMSIVNKAPEKIKILQSPAMGFRSIGDKTSNTGLISYTYSSRQQIMKEMLNRCVVNSPTVFYSASLYKNGMLKTQPEKYGGAADYDLYCSLIDNGFFIYPSPVWLGFYYRWHQEQATWKVHNEGKSYDKQIQEYWREKWKDKI